jgi:hypothetical protein
VKKYCSALSLVEQSVEQIGMVGNAQDLFWKLLGLNFG